MLYWLLYMMGLGMLSSDEEVCYEDSEEEDVDHASPPKDNEQVRTVRAALCIGSAAILLCAPQI